MDSAHQQHQVLSQFRIIFGAMRKHFRQLEQKTGLPGTEVWVLHLIDKHEDISVNEIAEAMYVHQSTVSNLIASLLRKNLITKEKNPRDRRVSVLRLTEEGSKRLAAAPAPREGLLPAMISQLTPEQLAQVDAAMSLLLEKMPLSTADLGHSPLATM